MSPPAPGPWLVAPVVRTRARLDLVVIPHAGAGPAAFRSWSDLLPSEVELHLANLPGRERRMGEPAYDSIEPVVDHLFAVLVERSRPLALFGHSMGALVAYELTRRCESEGVPLLRLFVSGHAAPDRWPSRVAAMADDDAAVLAALRRLGGTPGTVTAHAELMDLLLPTIRADLKLCASYRHPDYARPLTTPVTALGGQDDDLASPASMAAWRDHTVGPFRVVTFPGGHFYFQGLATAVVSTVVEDLTSSLFESPSRQSNSSQ